MRQWKRIEFKRQSPLQETLPQRYEIIYHKAMIVALSERGLSCESEREFFNILNIHTAV